MGAITRRALSLPVVMARGVEGVEAHGHYCCRAASRVVELRTGTVSSVPTRNVA